MQQKEEERRRRRGRDEISGMHSLRQIRSSPLHCLHRCHPPHPLNVPVVLRSGGHECALMCCVYVCKRARRGDQSGAVETSGSHGARMNAHVLEPLTHTTSQHTDQPPRGRSTRSLARAGRQHTTRAHNSHGQIDSRCTRVETGIDNRESNSRVPLSLSNTRTFCLSLSVRSCERRRRRRTRRRGQLELDHHRQRN